VDAAGRDQKVVAGARRPSSRCRRRASACYAT
jgi:hypothetical protein